MKTLFFLFLSSCSTLSLFKTTHDLMPITVEIIAKILANCEAKKQTWRVCFSDLSDEFEIIVEALSSKEGLSEEEKAHIKEEIKKQIAAQQKEEREVQHTEADSYDDLAHAKKN
jgi:hypothetical protein